MMHNRNKILGNQLHQYGAAVQRLKDAACLHHQGMMCLVTIVSCLYTQPVPLHDLITLIHSSRYSDSE